MTNPSATAPMGGVAFPPAPHQPPRKGPPPSREWPACQSGNIHSAAPPAVWPLTKAGGEGGSTLNSQPWLETLHSNRNLSPATGKSYDPLTPKHFSFNSPSGACPVCHGLGQKMVLDEDLVVPDQEKSIEQGAILSWRRGGKRMVSYYKGLLRGITSHYKQSLETPYKDLPKDFKK